MNIHEGKCSLAYDEYMYLHEISTFVKFLPVTALPKVGTIDFCAKQV